MADSEMATNRANATAYTTQCDSLGEAWEIVGELGNQPLAEVEQEILSTRNVAEAIHALMTELDSEIQSGKTVQVNQTTSWNEYRHYFPRGDGPVRENIRKAVASLSYNPSANGETYQKNNV